MDQQPMLLVLPRTWQPTRAMVVVDKMAQWAIALPIIVFGLTFCAALFGAAFAVIAAAIFAPGWLAWTCLNADHALNIAAAVTIVELLLIAGAAWYFKLEGLPNFLLFVTAGAVMYGFLFIIAVVPLVWVFFWPLWSLPDWSWPARLLIVFLWDLWVLHWIVRFKMFVLWIVRKWKKN